MRALRRIKDRPDLVVLALLVLAGAALRLWLTIQWRPAFLGFSDSATYIGNSEGPNFADPLRPVGYPVFLWATRAFSSDLSFAVVAQHALGVLGALCVYAAVRRLGAGRWSSLFPAAVLLLHGSTIWLEHAILTESVFTFFVCAALLPAALAVEEQRGIAARVGFALTSGLLLASAAAVRPVAVLLVPLFAAWLVWAIPGRWRGRLAAGLALALASAGLLGANLMWAHSEVGHYAFAQNDAYFYYARVATFADCREFTPPDGTRTLCSAKPPRERLGSAYWIFAPESDLVISYGPATRYHSPEETAEIEAFARAAVLGQPGDYMTAVGRDLVRLVDPHFPFSPNPSIANNSHGVTPDEYRRLLPVKGDFARANERATLGVVGRLYSTRGTRHRDIGGLETWEGVTRISGVKWLALFLLALGAPVLTSGARRKAAVLLAGAGVVLTVVPVMALSYDWRYQLPALGFLAGSAALAFDGIGNLIRSRRTRRPTSGRDVPPRPAP